MNKLFTGLLGMIFSGGAIFGSNAIANSGFTDWSYDMAAEQFPFLKEFEDTAFGAFAKDNWPVVAGGLAAYIAAPDWAKSIVGLATAGMMAFKAYGHFFANGFNREADGDQPSPNPEVAADPNAPVRLTREQIAERIAAGLNNMSPEQLAATSMRHGIIEADETPETALDGDSPELNAE